MTSMVTDQPKIYFCGSIKGGRSDQELYHDLITFIQSFGNVLTTHIGEKDLASDHNMLSREIYNRDTEWLKEADYVIAEVSTPSLGVGFEIATSIWLKKKILCLSQSKNNHKLSAMISGCPDLQVIVYSDLSEAEKAISRFLLQ